MSENPSKIPILVIVGPPRSGTSMMGRILGLHPQVGTWIEPYFVWDKHFRGAGDDCRSEINADPLVRKQIRSCFEKFRRALGVRWVVDKSPRSCLRLDFVKAVFPEARYLFLVRDGRDCVLSMSKQWAAKRGVAEGFKAGRGLEAKARLLARWLKRQPLWRYRLMALCFEVGSPAEWFKNGPLSRSRWGGRFGWGPRFRGWHELIDKVSPLEFAAHQWSHCAKGVAWGLRIIPKEQSLLVNYEDFILNPEEHLVQIFSFLQLRLPEGFMKKIPPIMSKNSGKWQKEFSSGELLKVGPIIQGALLELGYVEDGSWFQVTSEGKEMAVKRWESANGGWVG